MGNGMARITHDAIGKGERNGVEWTVGTGEKGPIKERFALYDDDGMRYYSGIIWGDDEGVPELEEKLWHWGAYDSGTTRLDIDGVPTIG